MASDPATRLSAARTRLVLDLPFLGALTLRLPLVAADPGWCPSTATDTRAIYYNPGYVAGLGPAQLEFVLAHAALHCALGHFQRRQHRVKQRWDLACDLAVNPLLAELGLRPPPDALMVDLYAGMTAEEIYPCLDEDDARQTHDGHLYDSESAAGGGREETEARPAGRRRAADEAAAEGGSDGTRPPPPLSVEERERLARQWQQTLVGAAQGARERGALAGPLQRLVERLLQPPLPWRAVLAQYLRGFGRDDFSYQRPSRREGQAILPTLRSPRLEVVAVLDTSGSIDADLLAGFVAELDALKGQVDARVTLHACDRELAGDGPWVAEPWESLVLPDGLAGGGGTAFAPPFEWLRRTGLQPDVLVYFTDADGVFPTAEPAYPVLWVVRGPRPVPWGRRIQYA